MIGLKKPVHRVSSGAGVNRKRFVVTLAPGDLIGFHDVRTRSTYWLPLAVCYAHAVKAEVARRKADRKAKKRARAAQGA